MRFDRKYLVAVALLGVLAVVFGLAGTVEPRSELVSPQTSRSSSSDSVAHFMNPPTYDSGWVNITDKCGQHVTLVHNLSTVDITVDITGRTANLTEENWHHFWSMGDINRDGYINTTDLDIWVAAIESGIYDPDADLNQDGKVDVHDYSIWTRNNGLNIWTYFHAGIHQKHLGLTCYTPGWTRTHGRADSDSGFSLVQTSDGGYAIAGHTYISMGNFVDIWLVKMDWTGNLQWNQTYGGTDWDYGYSLVQTDDGGYAIAGVKQPNVGPSDLWLIKTDANGNMEWNQTHGRAESDWVNSLIQTWDGGYAMAGNTGDYPDRDFWLIKTNSTGDMQWNQTYGGTDNEEAYSVVQTVDGGYALAGMTGSYPDEDALLVKTNSTGDMQWNQTYGGTNTDVANSVVQTDDRGYTIAGYTNSPGNYDFWLVKTNSTGDMQWNQTYGGTEDDRAVSLVQTNEGGYAMAGNTGDYPDRDFWLIKTDVNGVLQWNQTYGGTENDYAQCVIQTSDGGYALAGTTYSFGAGGVDLWLVKTDIETGLAWTCLPNNAITLYRGKTDPYWNYLRVRIWTIKEPTWMFGDINQDGVVDAEDLYIVSRNYGKTFSALSLTGIICTTGVYAYKKRKKQSA